MYRVEFESEISPTDAVVAATSAGDVATRPRLAPRQHRQGALHALMHMISGIAKSSEKPVLEEFSDFVFNCVSISLVP